MLWDLFVIGCDDNIFCSVYDTHSGDKKKVAQDDNSIQK
jgi:hypothetical protein